MFIDAAFEDNIPVLSSKAIIPSRYGTISWKNAPPSDLLEDQFPELVNDYFESGKCDRNLHIQYFDSSNNHLLTYYNLECAEERTYTFFLIKSKYNVPALLTLHSTEAIKVWVNTNLETVVPIGNKNLVVNFLKGTNLIVLENPILFSGDSTFIRISDYNCELNRSSPPCLFHNNLKYTNDLGTVAHSGIFFDKTHCFQFAFFPNHTVLGKNVEAEVLITDSINNHVLYNTIIKVKKRYTIDVGPYFFDDFFEGHYPIFTLKYRYENGRIHQESLPLYTGDTSQLIQYSCKQAVSEVSKCTDPYDAICLQFSLEYINSHMDKIPLALSQTDLLRANINRIHNGEHLSNDINSPGIKRIFFLNPLYNSTNLYRAFVPYGYDKSRSYPLILIFSTYEYGNDCACFENYKDEPVIVVDVSVRGITLGSYMDEATTKVIIKDILSRFNIDKSRIYCAGFSNGAGAAWAQIEAFPDFYAGALLTSGFFNQNLLCNTNNIKIINISSTKDALFNQNFKPFEENCEKDADSIGLVADGFSHSTLYRFWSNKDIISKLLSFRRNDYPQRVKYKTTRNRHRKAYWVEIHGISPGAAESFIEAEVISESKIKITSQNIIGFTLTIPPQIESLQYSVIVNNQMPFYFNIDKRCVHFTISDTVFPSQFEPVDSFSPIINEHKGNGLLDVYLDNLSIVIPVDCTEEVLSIARAYSEPYSNGFNAKIRIKYPIVTYDELLSQKHLNESSYIFIDTGERHPLLEEIKRNAAIYISKKGWKYRGIMHRGNCCVQQMVVSPWNPAKNIHLISFNNQEITNRNLFARKLIIPTYASGRHTYLNNDALVFDERGYHAILDYSCDAVDL